MLPPTVYKLLFDSSPVPEYLFSPSDDPVILAVNDATLALFGCTRGSLVGKRVFEVFPSDPREGSATGQSAVRDSLARVLASGKPDELAMQRYPIPVVGADGEAAFE